MGQEMFLNEENVSRQIFIVRGVKVMFDFHLAMLYEIETRALKQQVRRNLSRFPEDFMFQINKQEWRELITKCDKLTPFINTPSMPFVFTEQGIAMLSSVLRSEKAIIVNIAIMRTFVNIRKILENNRELSNKIDALEKKYDGKFQTVFSAIKELIGQRDQSRKPLGFIK